MTVLPLLAVGILMKFVAVLFILVCLILILVVLMQKGRGGGLSGAFAGGMASGLLGSKTGDFLTWVTVVLVGIFLLLAVLMAKYYRPSVSYGRDQPATTQQPVPSEQPAVPQPETPQPSAPQPGATEQPAPAPGPGVTQPAAPAGQPVPGGATTPPAPSNTTAPSGG